MSETIADRCNNLGWLLPPGMVLLKRYPVAALHADFFSCPGGKFRNFFNFSPAVSEKSERWSFVAAAALAEKGLPIPQGRCEVPGATCQVKNKFIPAAAAL
jgi:hypothetical protein